MDDDSGLLSGVRVLDATDRWGHLCGKVLSDLGAEVIKIEPPDGDDARWDGPYAADDTNARYGLTWEAYNNNKKGITLDITTVDGQDLLRELIPTADVFLESFGQGVMTELGLSYDALSAANPGLVYTTVTPFGSTGPYADFDASDLETMALGGAMSLTGEPDRQPLRCTLPQAYPWGGLVAAMGSVVAYYVRVIHGEGQHVDAPAISGTLSSCMTSPMIPLFTGGDSQRTGVFITGRTNTGAELRNFWRCADGWVNFALYWGQAGQHTHERLVEWMDEHDMATEYLLEKDWGEFELGEATQDEVDRIEGPIAEFIETVTQREFFDRFMEEGMLGYPIAGPELIENDSQLHDREFWTTLDHPRYGELTYPGRFAVFSDATCEVSRPAPQLGEHNVEIFIEELGIGRERFEQLTEAKVM